MSWGLLRSILIYYNPLRLWRLPSFYAPFVPTGALCFDIGAHVGNRVWAWSRLGATVVAVEPQAICFQFLSRWYGKKENVTLLKKGVGANAGTQPLFISSRTPTVTTFSASWIATVQQIDSFAGVQWNEKSTIEMITLDEMIAQFGVPAFCKIDVEGYEFEVLRGLSYPLPALSLEYIPAMMNTVFDCLDQLERLATYEYNWSVAESHRWQKPEWMPAQTIRQQFAQMSTHAPSGDLYARLKK